MEIIICITIGTILLLIILFYSKEGKSFITCLCAVGLFIIGEYAYIIDNPQAIDVYRGNTTLEITTTISDNNIIKKDTTVIFK